ncbi:winged helix-turn-helix domain-containing protein [Streptomyces erythrochromogenes]|uniref:winged helix-turn-helix domain-containing protein n=1 Tax=Streptomyces erythrochromogenes TaxID=285574 RepID=UPI00342E1D45
MPIFVDAEPPPYQQTAGILRTEITAGRFKPGQRLPAYRELQERFGIANMTARSAIAVLRREGLVRTIQGRGTFVLDPASALHVTPQLDPAPDHLDFIQIEGASDAGTDGHRDADAGLLKFERIAADLRDQIKARRLKPGRLLPSQSELMKTYQASSLTTQKAIRLLRNEGIVISRQGRGTFVTAPDQTREPGTLNRPATPLTELADTLHRLSDVVLGMDQQIKELAQHVADLEAELHQRPTRHRSTDGASQLDPGEVGAERVPAGGPL